MEITTNPAARVRVNPSNLPALGDNFVGDTVSYSGSLWQYADCWGEITAIKNNRFEITLTSGEVLSNVRLCSIYNLTLAHIPARNMVVA